MSEWDKAKKESGKDGKMMAKLVSDYSYKDPATAKKTDRKVKKAVAENLNRSRDFIFPMIEAAYLRKDMENAGALEDNMQWLNVFLLELELQVLPHTDARHLREPQIVKRALDGQALRIVHRRLQNNVNLGQIHAVCSLLSELGVFIPVRR